MELIKSPKKRLHISLEHSVKINCGLQPGSAHVEPRPPMSWTRDPLSARGSQDSQGRSTPRAREGHILRGRMRGTELGRSSSFELFLDIIWFPSCQPYDSFQASRTTHTFADPPESKPETPNAQCAVRIMTKQPPPRPLHTMTPPQLPSPGTSGSATPTATRPTPCPRPRTSPTCAPAP